jgi:hypothetical protein
MSHYSGMFIEGPSAGKYESSGLDRLIVDGFAYQHRMLVRFPRDGQTFGAWVPVGMSNATALQRIFDGYATAVLKPILEKTK